MSGEEKLSRKLLSPMRPVGFICGKIATGLFSHAIVLRVATMLLLACSMTSYAGLPDNLTINIGTSITTTKVKL